MGVERRQQPRFRCNVPCELHVGGHTLAGKVRDVSAGGLGVVADGPPADQGDEVVVELRVAGLPAIVVRALVWHVHAVRRSPEEKTLRSFGLVLSESAPDFADWVARLDTKAAAPKSSAAAPPPPPPRPAPAATREYRIRIKQTSGSRTCRVVASGATPEAASAAALDEVGAGWVVLEVAPLG